MDQFDEKLPVNEEAVKLHFVFSELSLEDCENLYARYGGTAENAANRIMDDISMNNWHDVTQLAQSLNIGIGKENVDVIHPTKTSSEWTIVSSPTAKSSVPFEFPIHSPASDGCYENDVRQRRNVAGMTREECKAALIVTQQNPEGKRLLKEIFEEESPKIVILMRGAPGCGKSTLANLLLAISNGGTICSADAYFEDRSGRYNFNRNYLNHAHELCQSNCRKALEKGISPVIIDNTNTTGHEMSPYIKLAIKHNYSLRLVEPFTSWKTNLKDLARRNIHGVPKDTISRMLDRYESTFAITLLQKEIKRMEDSGISVNYNPRIRRNSPPIDTNRPVLSSTVTASKQPLLSNIRFSSSQLNSPPPLPLLCDLLPELTDPGALGSSSTPRNQKGKKRIVSGPGRSRRNSTANMPSDKENLYTTNDTNRDDIEAEMLLNYFPNNGRIELLDAFSNCERRLDRTVDFLIESGYQMTTDTNVKRNSVHIERKSSEESVEYETQSKNNSSGFNAVEDSSSILLSGELGTNGIQRHLLGAIPKKTISRQDSLETDNEFSSTGSNSPEPDNIPVDGEDWVDLQLSSEFVETLSNLYGEPQGRPSSSLTLTETRIRLPPTMAFELFQYLSLNILRIERKDADEMSAAIFEKTTPTDDPIDSEDSFSDEVDEEMKELLHNIDQMKLETSSDIPVLSNIMKLENSISAMELSRLEKFKTIKRSMSQNIKFAQLKLAFPGLKPTVVDDFFVQNHFNYDSALAALKEVYPSKFYCSAGNSKKTNKQEVPGCLRQADNPYLYDPEKVSRMSATERREMGEHAHHWKQQYEEYSEAAKLYFAKANQHRSKNEVFSYFMVKAAEVKDLLKFAQTQYLFYTVLSLNAGNHDPNKIDLHGLSVKNALEIVADFLKNRTAWYENSQIREPLHLNIITGKGKHSENHIPKINPAVRNYLRSCHYSYSDQHGNFLVHLTRNRSNDKRGGRRK